MKPLTARFPGQGSPGVTRLAAERRAVLILAGSAAGVLAGHDAVMLVQVLP